jgi:hypothetical protein
MFSGVTKYQHQDRVSNLMRKKVAYFCSFSTPRHCYDAQG